MGVWKISADSKSVNTSIRQWGKSFWVYWACAMPRIGLRLRQRRQDEQQPTSSNFNVPRVLESAIRCYTGWWFQTFYIFHFIYGMSSFPLTDIFQRDWNHQPGNTRLCNVLHSRFDWLCYHFLVFFFFFEGYLRSDMNICCQGGLLWIVIILDIRLAVKTKPGFVYCKSVWSWNVLDDSHLPLDFIILFFVDGVDTQHQLGLCPNMGHI